LKKKEQFKFSREAALDDAKYSLQNTKRELENLLGECEQLQVTYAEKLFKKTEDKELLSDIERVQTLIQDLRIKRQKMMKLVRENVPDVEVIEKYSMLKTAQESRDDANGHVAVMSRRNTLLCFPDLVMEDWHATMKRMLGFPKTAHTADQVFYSSEPAKYASSTAFVHMLTLKGASDQSILALHVADENVIVMAVEAKSVPLPATSDDKHSIIVRAVDSNGDDLLSAEACEVHEVNQPIFTTSATDKRVKLFSAQRLEAGQDVFDLGTAFPMRKVHQMLPYCIVRESKSGAGKMLLYKVCKMNPNGGEEHLFSVPLENVPLRVVADRKGKFFAIIMQRATGSKKKTQKPESHKQGTYVLVCAKSDSGSSEPVTFIGDFGKQQSLKVSDVCFYHYGVTDFLVVAVGDRLVLLDYKAKRRDPKDECKELDSFQLGRMLPNTEPLIPTALATDRSGKMWIGCKGGVVLCWMLINDLSKHVSIFFLYLKKCRFFFF
jgi:hypothetical protein